MSARRLLVLCYFYPPLAGGGVHRILGFTRHLPEHGWSCTVVCAGEEDFWMRDESLETRVPQTVERVRVRGGGAISAWLKLKRRGGGRPPGAWTDRLRRWSDWWLLPDPYAGWSRRAAQVAEALLVSRRGVAASAFDAVLSSSPPDSIHLAGWRLKRRFGLPWVADFRDPWFGLSFRPPPTPWHRARQRTLERRVLAGADLVLAASRTHAADLERRARDDGIRRLAHLPNGYEADRLANFLAEDAGSVATEPASTFRMVFTGTLFRTPDTAVFLEALHDLLVRHPEARRRARVSFLGPFDPDDADRALALGLAGIVVFAGPRPHHEARTQQRAADLLLLWKPAGTAGRVPGRVYEYLDAARPVLAMLDPADETAEIVRRGGGTVVAEGDRVRLGEELERHYQAWRQGRPIRAARPPWLEAHDRARLSGQLAVWLDQLVEGRR